MVSKKFRLGMLVLVFGMTVVGSLFAQTDNRLNGRWVADIQKTSSSIEYIFNDANYETSINGLLANKGTYTINNGNIIFTITHLHGDYMNTVFNAFGIGIKLDSKLYTINEFRSAVRLSLRKAGVSNSNINDIIKPIISLNDTVPYSIDAKTLMLNINGEAITFNKHE
ncbi:hypothetical protein [Treponema sp. R80B11-R83G3]